MVIVLILILILAGAVWFLFDSVHSKARDSKRKQNLSDIQTAIIFYFAEHEATPLLANPNLKEELQSIDYSFVKDALKEHLPEDPLVNAGKDHLRYHYKSDGASYVLGAELENKLDNYKTFCPENWLKEGINYCVGNVGN